VVAELKPASGQCPAPVVARAPSTYAAIGGGRRTGEKLFRTIRASAVFIACAVMFALAPPAVADPADPIPGNGFFRVGPDIAPGLYHTAGTASTIGVWINNLPTPDEMCSWFTYSTPDPEKDHVIQANSSMAPMYANIPTTIKAFESQNCRPWTRVP
jgi:hypothetical protein